MEQFADRVAAITGAGSGIGQALARRFAAERCHLALADLDGPALEATAAELRSTGVRVTTTTLDVSDRDAVFAWADSSAQEHGKVNVIVNNAGVALSGEVRSLSLEDYRWIMDINFWGVVYGTKAFLPHLEAAGEGHVVNISSVFGLTAQPLMSGYNASKYAVRGFTESLRQELDLQGGGVSATCVHPGGIKTNIANTARVNDSVSAITGKSKEQSSSEFNRSLIWTPDFAAKTILRGVRRDKRRVLIGVDAYGFDAMARVAPAAYQRLTTTVVKARSAR